MPPLAASRRTAGEDDVAGADVRAGERQLRDAERRGDGCGGERGPTCVGLEHPAARGAPLVIGFTGSRTTAHKHVARMVEHVAEPDSVAVELFDLVARLAQTNREVVVLVTTVVTDGTIGRAVLLLVRGNTQQQPTHRPE